MADQLVLNDVFSEDSPSDNGLPIVTDTPNCGSELQSVTEARNSDNLNIITNTPIEIETTDALSCNDGQQIVSNTLNSDGGLQIITDAQNSNDGLQIITDAQNSKDGLQIITYAQNSNDGLQIITDAQNSDDGLQIITDAQNSNDGLQIITDAQNSNDGLQIITDAQNSNDGQQIITDAQTSNDGVQIVTNTQNSSEQSKFINDKSNSDDQIVTDAPNSDDECDNDNASTQISNLTSNSLSCNNIVNTLTFLNEKNVIDDVKLSDSNPLLDRFSSENGNFNIGDIVWAKIGKYPFWPSVVCVDPISKVYFKEIQGKNKFSLHVRFCNDKGRRSWTRMIKNYYGKCELLSKYPSCLSCIKNSKKIMDTWNLAVEEADDLLTLDGEIRMIKFFKTFLNLDSVVSLTTSSLNNLTEDDIAAARVRTYSRKRSLTNPEHDIDSKIIKTENISTNGSTSSRSTDIPLLSRSDYADSTVSDMSMSNVSIDDFDFKLKYRVIKNEKSTKTNTPKSSFTDEYNLSDSTETSPEYNNDHILVSDNHDKFTVSTMSSTNIQAVPKHEKLEISKSEKYKINSVVPYSRRSKRIIITKSYSTKPSDKEICSMNNDQNTNSIVHSQSSKKTMTKKTPVKELSTRRKSTTVKRECSIEPDTTGSEASFKNEPYNSIFSTSRKNKQLFIKILKRACVVCKNIEDTVKCTGSCQSYFHKECLSKSEERYHKNELKIKIKKTPGRPKRHYSKDTNKNDDSVTNISDITINIKENTDSLYEKDDNLVPKSLNGMKSLTDKHCSDHSSEDNESHDQPKSNDLTYNQNCNVTVNDDTLLNEFENVNTNSTQGTSEQTISDNVIANIRTNEKLSESDSKILCSLCKSNKIICFSCGLHIEDLEDKVICKMVSCGKYYHEKCLEHWPQCQWTQVSRNNVRCIICPHHVCHLCISDNPKSSCKTHFPAEKLTRCIKCPTAYHRSEYCFPAGSEVLTYNDIICSRHFEPVKMQNYHFNATWCFICTLGGELICCDLCPSSFHIKCLNQNPSEFENGFICEECQTGRYPLYGEIVWAKIGKYRWWPAKIIFPDQIPDTVNAIKHSVGEFAVRFFGSYDYYWVNRGRVFIFHEGDDENILTTTKVKSIDQVFQDAIIEAAQAHNAYILEKDKNDAIIAKKSATKPPKFIKTKFNKPFGNVKNMELDITTMTSCECDPNSPNPCGPGSDCINRMLMFECHPQLCPAKEKCNNQRFEKTLYPAMVPFLTNGRGWGLKTLEDIQEGSFVIEYVGDVIDEEEFQRRCLEMHKRNEQNYYFLTIDNSRMIDAGPKGNLSRFMNHSCEPNCVTQKWTVNGDTRIGLFALQDIPAGTELVFDYRLQSCFGVEKKPCHCGATRCSRFIGVKVEEEKKKVISLNDSEKFKVSTKNKRKSLKHKDVVFDPNKSKSSKVTNNDKNVSINENEIDTSNAEKIEDIKKSKTGVSCSKPSTILKKENLESLDVHVVVKNKWKNSTCNSTYITK